jgi:peptidoglycan hydrolase-like protein with peptidoglycan-binding domain
MSEAMHVSPVRRTVALLACMLAASVLLAPAQRAEAKGSPNTAALQVALKALHHYKGGIDGINGPRTKRAVRRYQRAHRLRPVDGVAGPRTRRKLGKRGRPSLGSRAVSVGDRGWDVAGIQWLLRRRGFKPHGVDGGFGQKTRAAVIRAQRRYGLTVDGVAGRSTINALKRNRGPRRRANQNVGNPSGPVRFLRPVRGVVTSPFGQRWGRLHAGIDFGAPTGAAVGAAGRGTVIAAGWNSGGYGNLVVIQHRLGFQTWYAHLSAVHVRAGEGVGGGTRIGSVGSTGASTGPHLHFEVRRNGTPIDPAPYLLGSYSLKRAKAQPDEHDHPEHCLPHGPVENDPEKARLVDCRTGGRPAP